MMVDPQTRLNNIEELEGKVCREERQRLEQGGILTAGDVSRYIGQYRDPHKGKISFQKMFNLSYRAARAIYDSCLESPEEAFNRRVTSAD